MELDKRLTANYYINVAITAWFLAQLSKTLLTLVLKKKLVMERMIGAGGMPSSHTALVWFSDHRDGQKNRSFLSGVRLGAGIGLYRDV